MFTIPHIYLCICTYVIFQVSQDTFKTTLFMLALLRFYSRNWSQAIEFCEVMHWKTLEKQCILKSGDKSIDCNL